MNELCFIWSLTGSTHSRVQYNSTYIIVLLYFSCVVYESENTLTQVLNQVTEEIKAFCDECSWIQELDKFLSVLGNACISGKMSQAMKPVEIEVCLMNMY